MTLESVTTSTANKAAWAAAAAAANTTMAAQLRTLMDAWVAAQSAPAPPTSDRVLRRLVIPDTAWTLRPADMGFDVLDFTADTDVKLTVPLAPKGEFPEAGVELRAWGAGTVSVIHAGGANHLRAPNGARSAHRFGVMGLAYRNEGGSDEWVVSGDTVF